MTKHAARRNTSCIALLFLLFVLVALTGLLAALEQSTPGGPLPTPTPPPAPEFRTPSPVIVEPNRRQSVVLVSLGGASAEALSGWMADGAMPTLSRLSERGWMTKLDSVSPPLPTFALTALATGTTSPDAEPIWQWAARHHRTTALLFWPGADPAMPDQRVDYVLACAPSSTAAGQQTVLLSPGKLWMGAPTSFSPPYEGKLPFPSPTGTTIWRVLAVDTLDDSLAAYDTFFFSPDSEGGQIVGGNILRLTLNEWGTLPAFGRAAPDPMLAVTGLRTLTSTATLSPTTGITPTATLSPTTSITLTTTLTPTATLTPTMPSAPRLELTLYHIAARPVTARPVALSREVIERFGFCPPLPDPRTVAQGRLPPAAFHKLASLRARWAMRAAAHVYETYRPHLLMVRQEALPASEQALLLTDARQPGYSPTRAAEFAGYRRAVATAVDDGLDNLLAVVDLNYAAVLIVSEYGMAPAHTEVNVAVALQTVWQWLAQLDGDLPVSRTSPGFHVKGAFVSIESGLYEKGENTVKADVLIQAMADLTDPRTGEPLFARVARHDDTGSWAAAWPYPGDILAQAAPGYTLTVAPFARDVFSETPVYGQTGYSARQLTMQGALFAAGRGVFTGQEGDITHVMDLTPTVAEWLRIPLPPNGSLTDQD